MTTTSAEKHTKLATVNVDNVLQLTEIFYSLQGEADTSGAPTIFIRLTGCPLRCVYCDTTYSFYGGDEWSFQNILNSIQQYPCNRVCVTGGEPLAQKNCISFLQLLLDENYDVSLETAGALPIKNVPNAVSNVMDLKTPSSKEEHRNLWKNIEFLTQNDQVKFVIMNKEDYEWSVSIVEKYELISKVNTVWFSPMFAIETQGKKQPIQSNHTSAIPSLAQELAGWILEDGLDVKLQLQLHKLLWADAMGK